MRKLKILGALFAALCAFGALMSASAFALPSYLPEVEQKWTGKAAETKLETVSKEEVKCTGAVAEGTVKAKEPLGPFHITFKGCKGFGFAPCLGTNDKEKETILVLGEWHLVWDSLKPLLDSILFLLTEPVHFSCELAGIKVLALVTGSVACLLEQTTVKGKVFEFNCLQKNGVQENSKYFNGAGAEVTAALLTEKNENGKPEASGQGGLGSFTLEKETELMV